ncbi:MAG: hypothetical protein QXF86_01880 [Candidatus Bilamarchaeaceae archaeon]
MARQTELKSNEILQQVPQKNITARILDTHKKHNQMIKKIEQRLDYLKEKYGIKEELGLYLLGFLAGAMDGKNYLKIVPLIFSNGKAMQVSEILKDKNIVFAIDDLKKLVKNKEEIYNFYNELEKLDSKDLSKEKLWEAYIKSYERKYILEYVSGLWEKSYTEGKYEIIPEEKKKIPELREELIELPPTTTDLYIYGSRPIYFDSQTGISGTKEQIKLVREAEIKKEIVGNDEMLLYLLPLIGTGYALVKDLRIIKEGSEQELIKIGKLRISEKDIGKGMLVLDLLFGWWDASFVIHLGAKSAVKTAAREIENVTKSGRAIAVSEINKKVLLKAAGELDNNEMKKFIEILGRNPNLGEEIVAKAGGVNNITKEILKEYINKEKTKISTVKETVLLLSERKFREYAPLVLFKEMAERTELESLRYLGQMAKGLDERERKIVLKAIFATLTTFDKNAQKSLANYVKKNGWKGIIEKIEMKKDVVRALQELFPEYKDAYKYAPLEDIVKTARDLGALHAVFVFVQLIGSYISTKEEEKLNEIEFMQGLKELSYKEKNKELLDLFMKSYENK